MGGEETTPAPLIQVKLQSGQKARFRLNFNVKPDGLVDLLLCTHALCFLVVVVLFFKYIISILGVLQILYSIEYLCDISVINYVVLACKLYNKTTKYKQVIISSKMICSYIHLNIS